MNSREVWGYPINETSRRGFKGKAPDIINNFHRKYVALEYQSSLDFQVKLMLKLN